VNFDLSTAQAFGVFDGAIINTTSRPKFEIASYLHSMTDIFLKSGPQKLARGTWHQPSLPFCALYMGLFTVQLVIVFPVLIVKENVERQNIVHNAASLREGRRVTEWTVEGLFNYITTVRQRLQLRQNLRLGQCFRNEVERSFKLRVHVRTTTRRHCKDDMPAVRRNRTHEKHSMLRSRTALYTEITRC